MAEIANNSGAYSVQTGTVRRIEDATIRDAHQPLFKRQKSERTETAEHLETVLHLGNGTRNGQEVVNGYDEVDGRQRLGGSFEDVLRAITPDSLDPEIGPRPQRVEIFENNIQIRHPEDGLESISLGVHLRKHKRGYRVHRVLDSKFRENDILREGDIVVFVGETNVTEMAIEEVKKLFWDWDFDVTLKLVILRETEEPGDETDSSRRLAPGADKYRLTTLSLHLEKEDNKVVFKAEVSDLGTGRYVTTEPSPQNYYIYVKEPGGTNELFLGVQDGHPTMMTMVNRPEFYWRKQITLDGDGTPLLLFLHHATNKTLCCDVNATEDTAWAKLAPRGFLPEGIRSEMDIRWIKMDLIEGDMFYMKSAVHQEHFMNVSQESSTTGRLRFARDTEPHPRWRIFFKTI